jgi:hypothetical protein
MTENKKNDRNGWIIFAIILLILVGIGFKIVGGHSDKLTPNTEVVNNDPSINPEISISENGDFYLQNTDKFTYPNIFISINYKYHYMWQIPILSGKKNGLNLRICATEMSGEHFNPEMEKVSHIEIKVVGKVPYDKADILGSKGFHYNNSKNSYDYD